MLEAIEKFKTLAPEEQERIRVKAQAYAEKSLGMFVHAVGSLNAPRENKKKVIEKLFGKSLKPGGRPDDGKAQGTIEAAILLGTAMVMYEEGLLSEKAPVIEIAQTIPEPPKP